jgi:hypothetical protein
MTVKFSSEGKSTFDTIAPLPIKLMCSGDSTYRKSMSILNDTTYYQVTAGMILALCKIIFFTSTANGNIKIGYSTTPGYANTPLSGEVLLTIPLPEVTAYKLHTLEIPPLLIPAGKYPLCLAILGDFYCQIWGFES